VAAFLQSARDLKAGGSIPGGPPLTAAALSSLDVKADGRGGGSQRSGVRSGSSLRWRDEAAEYAVDDQSPPHDAANLYGDGGPLPLRASDLLAVKSILKASAVASEPYAAAAPVDIKSYARKMANRQAVQKEHQSAGPSASKRTL
jgi:hypothetical protein